MISINHLKIVYTTYDTDTKIFVFRRVLFFSFNFLFNTGVNNKHEHILSYSKHGPQMHIYPNGVLTSWSINTNFHPSCQTANIQSAYTRRRVMFVIVSAQAVSKYMLRYERDSAGVMAYSQYMPVHITYLFNGYARSSDKCTFDWMPEFM